MNERTRQRQKQGQQQVRQLSGVAALLTALMFLAYPHYPAVQVWKATPLKLLKEVVAITPFSTALPVVAVGTIAATVGYILGRRQIQVQINQVVNQMFQQEHIQLLRNPSHGNFKPYFRKLESRNRQKRLRLRNSQH